MLIKKIKLLITAEKFLILQTTTVPILAHNSLKLSFTNIWGLHSNFVGCESFLESTLLTSLLCVRQTFMTQLIVTISSFKPKGLYYSYAWYCSLGRKEGLPFVRDSVSYFFLLYQSPFLSFCMVFDSISTNTDEVLSINPSANFFVFGD